MKKWLSLISTLFVCLQSSHTHALSSQAINATAYSAKKTGESLKILFIVDKFPYDFQVYIVNQIKGLMNLGHEVYVYAGREEGRMPSSLDDYDLSGKIFYQELPSAHRAYDIIYCQFGHLINRCLHLKQNNGLIGKLIVGLRGGDASSVLKRNPHYYGYIFKHVDLWLPVCDYFREEFIKIGCPHDRINVMHSVIDAADFPFKTRTIAPGEPINILTVCRLAATKGLEDGIYAVAEVIKKYPQIRYTIVGGGAMLEKLRTLVRDLGCESNITFVGAKNHAEIPSFIDQAHIFLHPSATSPSGMKEGIPNAPKEAMCAGLPVVSTLHSGIPELVENGISGFLVPEHDINGLTEKLTFLIEHPECWAAMGAAGNKKIMEEYELHSGSYQLEALLKQVISKNQCMRKPKNISQQTITTKPLNILFVVKKFPEGLQTFIINQMRGLLDRGHHLTILGQEQSNEMPQELADYNWENNVFYQTLPTNKRTFDVIYAQLGDLADWCLALKKNLGLEGKLVVGLRGEDASSIAKHHPERYQRIFNQVDLWLPVCEHFRKRFITMGCNPRKIKVLHSPIDCSKFSVQQKINRESEIRIVTACRLEAQKGIQDAVRSVAPLLRKFSNLEYWIIGDGKLKEQVAQLIKNLGIEDRVQMLGHKNHEEVVTLLEQCDIFLHPSVTSPGGIEEGIPNSIKEAMAKGLPIIATTHSGIPELVEHGVTGFLVEEHDIAGLTSHLDFLIKHPEVWRDMGEKGRKKIEQDFELEQENNRLIDFLYACLKS